MSKLAGACVVALLFHAHTAAADPTQLGAWLGPRIYANDSTLGYISDAPFHPVLQNTIAFGARIGRPFFPWLVPELELALAPTKTDAVGGAAAASIFWFQPRVHLRFQVMADKRLVPFAVIGGGSPIALSSARKTFNSGITGDGYVGGGVRFDSLRGFILRFDARVSLVPGVDHIIAPEIDIGFGIEFALGGRRRVHTSPDDRPVVAAVEDRDRDGIPDSTDKCPDRPEDQDGFEDTDGCPDIDNDMDRVLDVADKCINVPETYNGFLDDDGCPDTLPPEIDQLRGTIEGLLYAEGETMVRDSAKPNVGKIAKLMQTFPSIRIVLIGHTDDREAKQFADNQPNPDLAALAADLSRARAEAVRQWLVTAGIAAARIDIQGRGSEDSVSDNATPRGRLANRRVEVKLFVPPTPQ